MGMFDYVIVPGDSGEYQSKDGPCMLARIQRDAVDDHGAWVVNHYYGPGGEWRRGAYGWISVPME